MFDKISKIFEKLIIVFYIYVIWTPWNKFIKFIYWVVYLFIYVFDPKKYKLCNLSKREFDRIINSSELCEFFENKLKYVYTDVDKIIPHESSSLEYFMNNGNYYKDMGLFAYFKFKQLGYKSVKVFMISRMDLTLSHIDCLVKIQDKYFLFNYGRLVEGNNLDECIKNLSSEFYKHGIYFKYYL